MLNFDRRAHRLAPLALALALAACGGSSDADSGMPPAGDTGAGSPDAVTGPVDSGVPNDSGVPDDSGVVVDTGVVQDADTPDLGPADTGVPEDAEPADAEPADAEPMDAAQDAGPDAGLADATPDAGFDAGPADASPDAGPAVPDAGFNDAGVPVCIDGQEGCLCAFGQTCSDPSLTCFNASGTNVPPGQRVNVCLNECTTDADCASSSVGNFLCRPVVGVGTACVFEEHGEGALVDLSRRRGTPMSGCAPGLFAFPPFAGSGLPALEDDQASCGRPCHPAAPVGSPNRCTANFPYCNPNLLTSSVSPGICGIRAATPGTICSRTSAVGLCDTTASPDVACLGIPLGIYDPQDPSPNPDPGVCVLTCNLASPNCTAANDPSLGPATCRQIRASNQTTGFCSNQCTQFPSRCGKPTGLGAGSTCTGDLQLEAGFSFSFCRSAVPPVIPEFNFQGAPATRCLQVPGGEARCAPNTYCLNDNQGGLCIRTCNAAANPSGCELGTIGNNTCDDTLIGTAFDSLGACAP